MTGWSERRGVSDDLCYLRQAHLFKKHGLKGLHTDLRLETDGYFKSLVADVRQPEWDAPQQAICHVDMAAGKRVLQYPPGVGAFLSLFPERHQVVPLYIAASLIILLMSLIAIYFASTVGATAGVGLFGSLAMYFMINPAKASYSIAPTLALCAVTGLLSALLAFVDNSSPRRYLVISLLGIVLGLSVNFRIPNLLLATGFGVYFFVAFLKSQSFDRLIQGALFGLTLIFGMLPTLIANAINAGSPFATTYGGQDVSPPDFAFRITSTYLADLQGALIVAGIFATMWLAYSCRAKLVVLVVAINLIAGLGYFLSHPVFTSYYLMPLGMQTLWSVVFASVLSGSAIDNKNRSVTSK
jgi:hypothetical protein